MSGFGFGNNNNQQRGFGQQQPQQQQVGMGVGGFGAPPAAAPGKGGFGFGNAGGGGGGGGVGNTGGGAGGGFGSNQQRGGFGFGGGGGSSNQQQQQQQQPQFYTLTPAAKLLQHWYMTYDPMHPGCHFRHFFYNICTQGQAEQAILEERRRYEHIPEAQWAKARLGCPDFERMYPAPTHFFVGLEERMKKQQAQMDTYKKLSAALATKARNLRLRQDKANENYKARIEQQFKLEQMLLNTMAKAEVLRLQNVKAAQQEQLLLQRSNGLLNQLNASNRFKAAATELDAYVSGHALSGAAGATQMPVVENSVLRDWTLFLQRLESGLEALRSTLDVDLEDVAAVRERRLMAARRV